GREAFTAKPEYFAALRAGRHFYFSPAVDCRHFQLRAEYGVGNRNIQIVSYIEAIALQIGMYLLLNEDDKVAGHSAAFSRISLAAHAKLHTLLHAGRNVDRSSLFTINSS